MQRCLWFLFFVAASTHVAASSSKADALTLHVWGYVGYDMVNQSFDVSNGFTTQTISLPPLQMERQDPDGPSYFTSNYTPISSVYWPNTTLSDLYGLPYSIHAFLYDSTHGIAEINSWRETQNGPVMKDMTNYLSPSSAVDSLPSWFSGLSLEVGVIQSGSGHIVPFSPTVYVEPGPTQPSSQLPLESPVPEPSTYLVFACAALAVGLSRRFRGPA